MKKSPKNNRSRLVNLITIINKPRIGWGPLSAVLVTLGIYFGTQVFAAVPIGVYIAIKGYTGEQANNFVNNSILVQFSFLILVGIFSIYFLHIFLKIRKISWSQIGIKKPSLNNIFLAFPVFVVYFACIALVYGLVDTFVKSINTEQEQQIGFEGANGILPLALVFIGLVIIPAVVEEIMVRGFLYGGLVKKYKKITAALLTSGIFGFAHLQLGFGASPLWIAAIDTFILSMFLIYLRERTGNLFAGMLVHAIKNTLAFISIFILHIS